jgi:NodT family efflux transporter outer membrane factor (OMF) lipoprotein
VNEMILMKKQRKNFFQHGLTLVLAAGLSACAVGPDYQRPPVNVSSHFKQMDGWRQAAPGDALPKGAWWAMYQDPELSALLEQVQISNQNVAQYDAAYRKAAALVKTARASFYPTVSATVDGTRAGGKSSSADSTSTATLSASWEPDVWGKVRRTVEQDSASAAASQAQLASITLSAQSSLAQDYFQLRVMDEKIALYQQTVTAYEGYLKVVEQQFQVGSTSSATVATAQTQLESARASVLDLQWQRAQLEHAIAVLIGRPPAEFQIVARPLRYIVPAIPVGLPSALLERRPDVAYAERNMAAANAAIGVAQAAYYPDLTLSASGGTSGSPLSKLLSLSNRLWSLGAEVSGTVLDFGATSGGVEQARASYDGQVAAYRQAVLTGLQEVENYLVQLHTLETEIAVQQRSADAAKAAARLTYNQYRAGMINYLNVATTEATSLTQQQNVLTLISSQLVASVELIAALGGGWDVHDMPAAD